MLINLKVKTLDAQTHEFSIDNEITVREFKDLIAEKTNIAADQQRIIYCGRVLVDDKHLKDYDVDGKVLHVAERPPPSQGGASSSSTTNSYPNDEMPRGRPTARGGMRNSPLFRALDGMVVGTMAIPMNAGPNNGQVPLNASSSFCINRITVARHMLECANNIAAYLEDPERGLNNRPLDILSRGRWTMESTVVELAITAADLPQSQNIAEMVQGAVTAALRGNNNANVTVLQMPTMLSAHPPDVVADIEANALGDHAADSDAPTTAAVIIEDVTETEEDGSVSASSLAAQASSSTSSNGSSATAQSAADGGEQAANATSTGTNTDENGAGRRTSTRVLAEVIEEMRNVQNRLNPFIQQFYDLLQNEPNFESNDTSAIENSQRLYDRVSEALHYMSHAQHAISDLMLDVSQPAPRYLTCRPIMVEQSGYVSSNNYLANAAAAAASASVAAAAMRQQQQQQQQAQAQPQTGSSSNNNNSNDNGNPTVITISNPPGTATGSSPRPTTTASNNNATAAAVATTAAGIVEDPVDEPMVAPPPIPVSPTSANAANVGTQSNDNHQMRMARIIQAVVNSAPINTDFDVQINAPIATFGMPINAATAAALVRQQQQQHQQQQQQSDQSTSSDETTRQSNEGDNANAATSTATSTTNNSTLPTTATTMTANQARVNTITLPTTSTQTRSTSRPQVQIGNIHTGGWNGSFANVMSSFDRFLPCNSHHIPDNTNGNNNNNNPGSNGADGAATVPPNNGTPNTNNNNNNSNRVGSTLTSPLHSRNRHLRSSNIMLRNLLGYPPSIATRDTSAGTATVSVGLGLTHDGHRSNLRTQLQDFLNDKIFEGEPINEDTIPQAVTRVVRWFGESLLYLPQYEKAGYDSRDSVSKILQRSLPPLFLLFNEASETAVRFETRLKQIFEQFVKRLYSVIFVCVGRDNAELYWAQLMRQLLVPVRSTFRSEALQFLCVYINPNVPNTTDTADAEQFIVHRESAATESACPSFVESPPAFRVQPMETDEAPMCVPESSDIDDIELNNAVELVDAAADVVPLPNVIIGSDAWHRNFPNDWLPIITRDMQNQSETPPTQAPYSDAYISGMSAKRRKLIQSTKSSTDIRSLVGESVRRAIQSVGVSNSTASNQSQTADEIVGAIANDSAVQASYTEAVRSNVRERIKQEADYKSDKFPHITNFINNK